MADIFKKHLNSIIRKHLLVYAVMVIAALVVGIFFYFQQEVSTQSALAEQILEREKVVIKAGNVLLDAFMTTLSDQVLAYSTKPEIVAFDRLSVQKDLGILINSWKNGLVSEVILVDANGLVKFGIDRQGNTLGVGIDFSEREYFKWATTANEGDKFIGDPILAQIGSSKGEYVVPVASPIIKNGKFNGVLAAFFPLNEATTQFLDPLKISDNTLIYLIDKSGVILSASAQNLTGVNYLDYVRNIPGGGDTVQKFNTILSADTTGSVIATLPDETKNRTPSQFLIVYSPISLGSAHWVFSIATPKEVAVSYAKPFYRDQLISLVYLIIVVLIFAIAGITSYRIGSRIKK